MDDLERIYPPTYYSFASGGGEEATGLVQAVKQRLDARAYKRAAELIGTDAPRILDVGGGTGAIVAGFVRASGGRARATVLDLDPDSVAAARKRGLEGAVGRIEDYDHGGEAFDLVVMLNLIEHVADPAAALAKAHGLLREGGLVWLQTPNFRALDARLFRHRNWAGYHCPRHWVIFSESGLRRLLRRAGLEALDFQRNQGGSFWAQSLLGLRRAGAARRDEGGGPRWRTRPEELPKPLVASPAFAPLAAAGAAFDIVTRRLRPVSQVTVMARPSRLD